MFKTTTIVAFVIITEEMGIFAFKKELFFNNFALTHNNVTEELSIFAVKMFFQNIYLKLHLRRRKQNC